MEILQIYCKARSQIISYKSEENQGAFDTAKRQLEVATSMSECGKKQCRYSN